MLVARDVWLGAPGAPAEPVVRGVSLDLKSGEWLAITGPNGGGKSTLLLGLAGLAPLTRGSVRLDGRSLDPDAADSRRQVAVVLQDLPSQLLQTSVAEEIAFGPMNLGWTGDAVTAAVGEWTARLGLEGLGARDPRELSAGFQQLVLLAGALATRPRVLLVDEGGAHLDAVTRDRVMAVLREQVARGLALIWVTQERSEIAAADRTIVVDQGRIAVDADSRAAIGGAAAIRGEAPRRRDGGAPLARVVIEAPHSVPGPARVALPGRGVWEIPGRGVLALTGGNGTGKTTLLGAIAGLAATSQISVEWLRETVPGPILASQHPEEQVFAETVEEEVLFAAIHRGSDPSEARRAAMVHFEALGLGGGFVERRTWSLSLGEKRLVQVVGALIAPACVALLDEPTAGVDPDRREAMSALILGRGDGGPVVVAGQDQEWLLRLAEGRIKLGLELASPSKKTD